MTINFGRPIPSTESPSFTSFAFLSYSLKASNKIEKSSSGVHDVDDTRSAGRSVRSIGYVADGAEGETKEYEISVSRATSVGVIAERVRRVNGVAFGEEHSGMNDVREPDVKEEFSLLKSYNTISINHDGTEVY